VTTLATAVSDHRGLRIDLADRIRGCGEFSAALAERVGELVADVEQSFLVVVRKITEGNGNLALMLLPDKALLPEAGVGDLDDGAAAVGGMRVPLEATGEIVSNSGRRRVCCGGAVDRRCLPGPPSEAVLPLRSGRLQGSMQQQAVHFCQHGSGGEVLTRDVHELVGATWNY